MSGAEYYNHSSFPSTGSSGSSSSMRAELELVEAGFGKLPDLSGNGGKIVAVNSGGTALEAVALSAIGAQPLDATLTALAAVVTAANKLIYATGSDAFATTDLSAFIRTLLDDTDAATALATLGAQPLDATLTALAAVTTAANKLIYATGVDTFATSDLTAAGLALLDDANADAQLTTLGFSAAGKALIDDASADAQLTTLGATATGSSIFKAASAAAARSTLGAAASGANTDITSLSAPALGAATATTQAVGDNSTKVATTAFVMANGAMTSGTAQASTSGTSIDFTSIPSGTKLIHIALAGVSTNSTDTIIGQIGDSGGVETSGYANGSSYFYISASILAGNTMSGVVTLTLVDSSTNTWAMGTHTTGGGTDFAAGDSKSLTGTLDRVRITTVNGSHTFDAGKINIIYS